MAVSFTFSQTFVTLSLKDIACRASLPDATAAHREILKMVCTSSLLRLDFVRLRQQIRNKEIFARIDEAEGVVSFQDDPNQVRFP